MNSPEELKQECQSNSPDYKLACELGYELSKKDFTDLYEYSNLVLLDYSNHKLPPSLSKYSGSFPISGSSSRSTFPSRSNLSYNEDLWIKYLRDYFESGSNGYELIYHIRP